jgi:flavodoxin I
MKSLVLYDSFFGNTEQIGLAIASGLGSAPEVKTLRVKDVKPEHLAGVGLLVVGSPTRGFRPSEATQSWLRGLPAKGLAGVKVAAFDTGIAPSDVKQGFLRFMIKIFGYAARPLANQLEKKGGTLVLAPEGFWVLDTKGPLKQGELERAAAWGQRIRKISKP